MLCIRCHLHMQELKVHSRDKLIAYEYISVVSAKNYPKILFQPTDYSLTSCFLLNDKMKTKIKLHYEYEIVLSQSKDAEVQN